MEFIYAAELKKKFTCYGHFYQLELMDGQRVKCRSVLEIVSDAVRQDEPETLSERRPDAVVIMMNPGSSRPKVAGVEEECLTYPQLAEPRQKPLVLTQPDNTQYQVMRIAVEQGWNHIRILNLSDLRDPKSGSFLQTVAELREVMGGHVHSIFSPERAAECAFALQREGRTPLVLGWGQDQGLLPLVTVCLEQISSEPRVTVSSPAHPSLNAHPSPMMQKKKVEWLELMLRALAESEKKPS